LEGKKIADSIIYKQKWRNAWFLNEREKRIPHCGVQEAHQILQQLTVCAQRPSNRIKAVHYLPLQINSNN